MDEDDIAHGKIGGIDCFLTSIAAYSDRHRSQRRLHVLEYLVLVVGADAAHQRDDGDRDNDRRSLDPARRCVHFSIISSWQGHPKNNADDGSDGKEDDHSVAASFAVEREKRNGLLHSLLVLSVLQLPLLDAFR